MRGNRVDWGHLGFILAIAAAVLWYLADTLSVSTAMNNLLFVVPTGVIALVLCVLIMRQCVGKIGTVAPSAAADGAPAPAVRGGALRIAGVAASLVFLVVLLDVVGFDGAILLFCAASMWICGERRPVPLIVYPLLVTLAVVLGFRAVLPFPMRTIVL